jgi:two-component system, cell cycle sensor histidine kinase and response regulator CckA
VTSLNGHMNSCNDGPVGCSQGKPRGAPIDEALLAGVRVALPAAEVNVVSADVATMSVASVGAGELILLVDDNTAVRETIAAMLSTHHYRVLGAVDGAEAINLFTAHSAGIALVITDLDMPGLGGVELTRILRQLRPDLRVLIISGSADGGLDGLVVEAEANLTPAFLFKPFNTKVLLERVHQLLQPPTGP